MVLAEDPVTLGRWVIENLIENRKVVGCCWSWAPSVSVSVGAKYEFDVMRKDD